MQRWVAGIHLPSAGMLRVLNLLLMSSGDRSPPGAAPDHDGVQETPAGYGMIPVVGIGRGGRGEFSIDGYPVGRGYRKIQRPYDLEDPNAFAVRVSGESMAPRYEAGDIVVCSPQKGWQSGDYCVVIKKDDEVLIKKVKDEGESILLISVAAGYDPVLVYKKEIRAIHKIVWKKER